MTVRAIIVAFPLWLAAAPHAAGAGTPLLAHLVVRVYEIAGLDVELKTAALAVANRTLASAVHNSRGLMRPRWLVEELRRGRHSDWMFTDQEQAVIRSRLAQAARLQRTF